ncbi:DegV family protein [Faecalibacterium gallinarum]|uniref:DegV family protein n=1 Tax=Faecalibacterium gallinarum TaxID=2903556 RepID=A0AA37IYP6_9FIRM|nr:DegV family protein [Faecalibacterium gallinarum]GJN64660.1 hypothetical protein JCM17207_12850 [Faecalibacterium gallinarum]
MKSKIIVDSSANLYQMDGVEFQSVPMKIITSEAEYTDTPELDVVDMAKTMRSYKGKSSTSCPNVGDWMEAFEGADEVYAVTITGTLSGCYNAACTAKEEYEDAHPGAKVFILDSLSTGPEMTLIAERMRELILAGRSFEQVCEEVTEYSRHTHLLFSLESLNNLARNGRCSPAVAAVARMLGIRVVGQASSGGELEVICKTRGEHGALERIVLEMKSHGYDGGRVRIVHSDNPNAAHRLKNMIEAVFSGVQAEVIACGGLCAYYAELGGLLVGYEDAKAPTV